jgi:peptidoglycan/LPS O-acetylase OafA/YrhL
MNLSKPEIGTTNSKMHRQVRIAPQLDFTKRIPELDGIRGLAILMILIYHYFVLQRGEWLSRHLVAVGRFGWSGVDLFFVLSGFLIGGILLDAKGTTNYYRVFYIRRFYRILPLYFAICLVSVAVFYAHLSTHAWLFEGKIPWYAYVTFGQNFWMAKLHAMSSRQIDATWSLAIEEQFYLTLPVIIQLVKDRFLPYAIAAGIVAAPLIRIAIWFTLGPANGALATHLLAPCRMDSLLLGALAAWWVRRDCRWQSLIAWRPLLTAASLILGIGLAFIVRLHWNVGSFALAAFGYTWIALFYLSLLLLALTNRKGWLSWVFTLRPLTYLGLLAYGLYLLHQPVLGLVYGLLGKTTPKLENIIDLGLILITGLVLLLIARFSWDHFEKPLVKIGHMYLYK